MFYFFYDSFLGFRGMTFILLPLPYLETRRGLSTVRPPGRRPRVLRSYHDRFE